MKLLLRSRPSLDILTKSDFCACKAEGGSGIEAGHMIEAKIRLWENEVYKIELYSDYRNIAA